MPRFVLALILALLSAPPTLAATCEAVIESVQAAKADTQPGAFQRASVPPASGWEPATLPDQWKRRWPTHDGTVWYRIDWQRNCDNAGDPLSLVIGSINMAGEVYLNDDLIWRDRHLHEPMSRSWNMPRQWILPESALREGRNTFWIKVNGHVMESAGLGRVSLSSVAEGHELFKELWLFNRAMFQTGIIISLLIGGLFAGIWLLFRRDTMHGWFALTNLSWAAFAWNVLATGTWPFPDTHTLLRANAMALVLHAACFQMFVWRRRSPRPAGPGHAPRVLAAAVLAAALALLLTPAPHLAAAIDWTANPAIALYLCANLGLMVQALRSRQRGDTVIAAMAALFMLVAAHDVLVLHGLLPSRHAYAPFAGLLMTLVITVTLALRIARAMRRTEQFNQELNTAVEQACQDLETAMRHERDLAVANSRLHERLSMTYDLHDSLGSAIGRAIAAAERHPPDAPGHARHLSTLRSLRDDLRQIIDNAPSEAGRGNASPVDWAAPARHRFSTLFDELGIQGHWHLPGAWPANPPSPRQCLALTRVLEEALTNVVKHSRARNVWITLEFPGDGQLLLRIADDGQGFDADAASDEGHGIGMRSMHERMRSLGGRLQVRSRPGQTILSAHLTGAEP